MRSIATMHDRSNGLGGGFAGYGIYPQYKDYYALHIFYDDTAARKTCEDFLEEHFDIVNLSKIPTRKIPAITDEPMIWRYFVRPLHTKLESSQLDEREFTSRCVIRINAEIEGAFVFSSGKNMGVFKAVGYPEDVGRLLPPGGIRGLLLDGARPLPDEHAGLVGAARTPSRCWTSRSCTTARSAPTTRTAASSRCTATSARF